MDDESQPSTPSFAQPATPSASTSTAPIPRVKSRVYNSQVAKEGDVQKYRAKYKDLRMKVKQIEKDNDKLMLKILKAKRSIQRARVERALIYERLNSALHPSAAPGAADAGAAGPAPQPGDGAAADIEGFFLAQQHQQQQPPYQDGANGHAAAPAGNGQSELPIQPMSGSRSGGEGFAGAMQQD